MSFNVIPFWSFWILAGVIAGQILMLKKKGIQVSSKAGKKNKINKFLFLVFGLVFLMWLFEITKPVFHFSFSILPESFTRYLSECIILKIAGTLFIVFSLVILGITLVHFDTSLRFGLDENNTGKLIITGIFSVSRNPFFLSLLFYFFGVVLIFFNLFFITFSLFAIIGIHLFILKEEKFLREVYGEEYISYMKGTRRYLGFCKNQ